MTVAERLGGTNSSSTLLFSHYCSELSSVLVFTANRNYFVGCVSGEIVCEKAH